MRSALVTVFLASLLVVAPASAGTISIALPVPTWATEDGGSVTVSGTSDSTSSAGVVAVAQRSGTCAAQPPQEVRSDPLVADLALDAPVSGPFSKKSGLIVYAPGTVCAWLTEDSTKTVTVASARLAPRYRFPRDSSMPFINSYPKAGLGLVTYFRKDRTTKFVASCNEGHGRTHGPHDGQRFTMVRSIRPDPVTGVFKASGTPKPDNSNNYDSPIPKPYHGKAHLTIDGRLYANRTHIDATIAIKARFTLTGSGLHCTAETVKALGT